MNKAYNERPVRIVATGEQIDLVNEAQACLRQLFKAMMGLEWAIRHNNQSDKALYLGSFREHKDLFVAQVESGDFNKYWKMKLYSDLLNCCLTLLKHGHDLYPFHKKILKIIHHYINKVVQRMYEINKEPEVDLLKNAMRLSYNYYCERVLDEYQKPEPNREMINKWLLMIIDIRKVQDNNEKGVK